MKIGLLGTGMAGKTIAARLAGLGHDVMVGTRDAAATLARTESDRAGSPPFSVWHGQHPEIKLGTPAEAAAHGDIVVNATAGGGSIAALTAAGAANLAGKVLLDIANPLDSSHGRPPTLLVKDTDSLAEQIQRAFPEARVVKALNTTNAFVMVDPKQLPGGDTTIFVSGDDADAKATVVGLLHEFGWTDVIDLGDISTARGAEMMLPMWLRLMTALGTPMFNFKIVR
jgi:8-hydroxy-5-deazaflavin:NADPH oxidoreductase